MLNRIKNLWAETALTSAIESVVRESQRGNALNVQKWYFKFKKEAYNQSKKSLEPTSAIEAMALLKVGPEKSALYHEIVDRLSQPGGTLEEVNEWLKYHTPDEMP